MAKRKTFKSAIDKVSNSQKDNSTELEKTKEMIELELSTEEAVKKADALKAKRKKSKPKFSLEDAKESNKKLEKKRSPVTLMMRPDIKKILNDIAENKGSRLSVILEEILKDYFNLPD